MWLLFWLIEKNSKKTCKELELYILAPLSNGNIWMRLMSIWYWPIGPITSWPILEFFFCFTCKTSLWLTVMNVMTSLKHQLRSIDRSIDRLRINSLILFECFAIFQSLCVFGIICYNHHHHHSFNRSEWNVVCKLYNKILNKRQKKHWLKKYW